MRGEFVEVDSRRIYYYAAGSRGHGDPIVLLHGFPTSGHLWSELVSILPQGHRIVVPDLLGYGRSDPGERSELSIPAHAARIGGLLDALGIQRCSIVGHHLGACVATTIAARLPDRVSHLGLLHPLGGDVTWTGAFAVLRAFLPLVRLTPFALVRPALRNELARWFSDPLKARAQVEQYLSVWRTPANWRQLLRHLAALRAEDVVAATEQLRQLNIPVSILAGEDDPAVPRVALDRLREACPSAALDIIRGVRHFSPEESPEHVAGFVERLLRS
jgi:pimeloyl-ACP methyl ester carboxylesterase